MSPSEFPPELIILEAAHVVAEAVFYLAYAVSTLAVVGMIGYWVALKQMREDKDAARRNW